ncbi:MAG TPA: sortase [Streptosporangiaceae bacterium]|nr:sortase [Streptosporangiaceae bacterium]
MRQVIRAAGEILLTAGVVGLLFLGYLVWGTGLRAASAQRALSGELNQEWRQGPVRGRRRRRQLNVSPGHVPGTQWPGQLGNFAVAGHRVTAGNPFWSLPSMKDGDLVYVQTRLNNYTYRVIGKQWVAPTDTAVLDRCRGVRGSGRTGG